MARPIPRPEPVTSATWSLSSIRTTRIEGRKRRGKQASRRGPHPFPTRWPRTVPQFRCNSPSANLIWHNSFFGSYFKFFCGSHFMDSLNWLNLPRRLVTRLGPLLNSRLRFMLMRQIAFSCSITVILLSFSFAGCGGYSGTGSVNGNGPVAPYVTTQPANQTVTAGQTATFSVVVSGTAPLNYQWQKNGADITGATSSSYMTPVTTTSDSGEMFRVMVSNSAGSATSNSAALTVNPGTTSSSADVITYHYDNSRSGQNLNETTLTPANVNSTTFGKKGEFTVDGKVDAQPLYLSQVTINGQKKNVLYVATEHGSVYAFDADSINGMTSAFLWKTSTLGSGETPSDDRG